MDTPNRQSDDKLDVKATDDKIRKSGEMVERANYWLSKTDTRFFDEYVGGVLNFGFFHVLGDQCQEGFTISRTHLPKFGDDELSISGFPSNAEMRGGVIDSQKSVVFSRDVECMEGKDGVIPSTIRLQRFDDLSHIIGNRPYKFRPFVVPSMEGINAFGDRKVNVVATSYVVAIGDTGRKNIKRCADYIDVSANLDAERERKIALLDRYQKVMRNVRICLFDDHADVVVAPSCQSFFEGWQIGYGPVDACFSV